MAVLAMRTLSLGVYIWAPDFTIRGPYKGPLILGNSHMTIYGCCGCGTPFPLDGSNKVDPPESTPWEYESPELGGTILCTILHYAMYHTMI